MIFSNTTVAGFKIPLNTASITSQDERENILNELSKLEASTTLSLNKGKRPIF